MEINKNIAGSFYIDGKKIGEAVNIAISEKYNVIHHKNLYTLRGQSQFVAIINEMTWYNIDINAGNYNELNKIYCEIGVPENDDRDNLVPNQKSCAICIKCNFHNEYMAPQNNYICFNCR